MPVMRNRAEGIEQASAHAHDGRVVPTAQDRCAATSTEATRFSGRGAVFAQQTVAIVNLTGRNGDRNDREEWRAGGLAALRAMAKHERTGRPAEMDANCAARAVSSNPFHGHANNVLLNGGHATAGRMAS